MYICSVFLISCEEECGSLSHSKKCID